MKAQRTILLVDDDAAQLKLSHARLVSSGFTVHAVDSASRALLAVKDLRPDLVASDVLMGEVDGFNLCRLLRADAELAAVPVVLMSAHFDEIRDRKLAQAVGATDLVRRTPEFTAELDAIKRALSVDRCAPPRHGMDTDTTDLYGERMSAQLVRQVEKARVAETRYLTLFENATDAISIVSADGTIIEVNRRWEDILGVPREQIVGKSVRAFAPAGGEDHNEATVREQAAGTGGMTRFAVRRADGTTAWLEGGNTPIAQGARQLVFTIARDITTDLEAADRLARSETKYRAIIDNIPDMVWTANADGRVLFVGANCEKVTTFTQAELLTQTRARAGVHPADAPAVNAAWVAFVAGRGEFDTEYRRRRRDGSWMWVHNRAMAPREVSGDRVIDGLLTDISERKRLEEQMRQAQKMEAIGQLSGGIAHDFNNLLSVIMANCHFLLEALGDQDPRRADALEIEAAGHRAAALTRQLLAFSRRQALAPALTDLGAAITGLEKMLRRLIGEDIELTVERGDDLGAVRVDVGQIEQVVMNLVVNARDAMPDGGTLAIAVVNAELDADTAPEGVPAGRYVAITVADTGCGMDAETRTRIFEPFFTTKEVGKGTGLGLSTCYGIVRQSDGHIHVDSEPGRGSRFTVFLPRADTAAAATAASSIAALGGTETILVIEDDDRVRAVTSRMLTARGYRVLTARSGAEAIGIAKQLTGQLDLVLSDLVLPGLPGTAAVTRVRAILPYVRALFMSGYTEHAALRGDLLHDGAPLIHKPFTLDELARKVREVLDAPRAATGSGRLPEV